MSDLQELLTRIKTFRDRRDWKQFHRPKDLAEALSIEAGEVLELFLWKNHDEISEALKHTTYREELSDELADVLHYLLLLADAAGIDLVQASKHKLQIAEQNYPVEKSKGTATKYTKLSSGEYPHQQGQE
ncbi:nucleotide pyrophosphohydrolase [Candidatus Roizmanbacteria bacterium]|nr:nucleotide pyrophosphohydrolase [Candidatus Roizmanbacteria bacterium]